MKSQVKKSHSLFPGIFLVFLGILLLLRHEGWWEWHILRSYGLLIVGLALIFRGISSSSPRGLFLATVLALMGGYFLLGEWNILVIKRGLTLSVLMLVLGVACYVQFFLKFRKWDYLIFGNLLVLIGILFLLNYLDIFPRYLFIDIVDRYWPVVLIVMGFILLLNSLRKPKTTSTSTVEKQVKESGF